MKKYSIKIKEARINNQLNQTELANMLNTKQQVISEYENGTITPSLDRLVELAIILDVTLDELIVFKDIQSTISKKYNGSE